MTVTPFGLVFMTLGFTLLVARRAWLLPLLVVSAGLHAFAVVIIGPAKPGAGLGVSPWLFACGLIFIHLVAIIARSRRLELGTTRSVRLIFFGWMVYTIWCVLSAFTQPFIFEGLQVNTLARWDGFDIPTEPMKWTLVNAVQAFNTAVIGMVFIYLLQIANDSATTRRIFVGFAIALGLSVMLSLCQRLQSMNLISYIDLLNVSLNPSYQQNTMLSADGTYLRLNWPFSEPSYASVWFGAFMVGGISIYLLSNYAMTSLPFIALGAVGLLNCMGGSGVGGSAVGIAVLLIISILAAIKIENNSKRSIKMIFVGGVMVALIIGIYLIIHKDQPNLPDFLRLLETLVRERLSGHDAGRIRSNVEALLIVKNTWGLGVGLGSNRASSYLLSMVSNIGVPGFLLFLTLFGSQIFILFNKRMNVNDINITFVLGGAIGGFFSVSLGIPDVNFPAWWIWVLATFGMLAARSSVRAPQ